MATYLEIGTGHLAGMSLPLNSVEVSFPPKPLARSVIENCARAQWVLGRKGDKAEGRLARAYLEEFDNSMVAKRTAGHLGRKADPVHQAARARWKEVRARVIAAFSDATPMTIDVGELGGEEQPGVEECLNWFLELLREHAGGTFDEKQAQALASTFSNFGADPSPVKAFGDAIAAALPGTLAPSTA
ncbi:hypothetical protein ACIO3S_24390 [Nocardioides sp. NPDC087217]|uniref:hypothetical protein n=1 Tax=Nocardioides sp. NPDC087217 TaxID=3364335 RepID=UPI00382C0E59